MTYKPDQEVIEELVKRFAVKEQPEWIAGNIPTKLLSDFISALRKEDRKATNGWLLNFLVENQDKTVTELIDLLSRPATTFPTNEAVD